MRARALVLAPLAVGACVLVALALSHRGGHGEPARPAPGADAPRQDANGPSWPRVVWHRSRALGAPYDGRLLRGVQLPAVGRDWFTWDPVRKRIPNRVWRRWGTDRLVHTLLRVLREYRAAHPGAPRVGLADLSRPHGGEFGRRFGGLGHASHQNGLDADVLYPRRDRLERRAYAPHLVDRALAQDLVDRFVAAGARYVFVGPRVRLHGRRDVVVPLVHHDDHLHVRIRLRQPR